MKFDLSLYLVLDPEMCGGFDAALKLTQQVLDAGVTVLQLRAPQWKKRDWLRLSQQILPMSREANVPFLINDHIDIALACDADGVHLGQGDLPLAVARQLLGPDKILGVTAATVADAVEAQAAGADYLGSGAVYPTSTKPGKAVLPLMTLSQIKQAVHIPVVAIGGISADNIGALRQSKVDGVAVVSAIMDSSDPAAAARALRILWEG